MVNPGIWCVGRMSASAHVAVDGCFSDKLLSILRGLDQDQLEGFKLGLQSPQLLPQNSPKIPWANVKAADPGALLCLLKEHFPERQVWEVTLRIFEDMNLTSLCRGLRAQMNGEWGWGMGIREMGIRGMGDMGEGVCGATLGDRELILSARVLLLDFNGVD